MDPFSCSNFNCVLFATCVCLYLLQIPHLICTHSLESIMRTGLTSYICKHQALSDKPPCSYLNQLRSTAGQAKFSPTELHRSSKESWEIPQFFSHLSFIKVTVAQGGNNERLLLKAWNWHPNLTWDFEASLGLKSHSELNISIWQILFTTTHIMSCQHHGWRLLSILFQSQNMR